MRKIITILLLAISITGCFVNRRAGKSFNPDYNYPVSNNVFENTQNKNITNSGFFIQKAEVEIISKEGREKYLASIKFEMPDKYLISLKNRAGIEGARIYISDDSILVNDRINKKLYSGNSFYLKKKFGITKDFLPLIFGDVIFDKNCEDSTKKCTGSTIITQCQMKGVILNYDIDCSRRKVVTASLIDNFGRNVIKLRFGKFFSTGSKLIPGIIDFEGSELNSAVKIKILKVETPWNGNIKFIPGKGYELIEVV